MNKSLIKGIISIIVLLAVTMNVTVFSESIYNIPLTVKQQNWVIYQCKRNHVSPTLVFAIIKEEANFKNCSANAYGCIGYMQINEDTANATIAWLKKVDPTQYKEVLTGYNLYDFYTNTHVAICALRMLGEQCDDIYQTLLAYGMGLSGANTYIHNHGYKMPKYMTKMLGYQQQIQTYGKIIHDIQ